MKLKMRGTSASVAQVANQRNLGLLRAISLLSGKYTNVVHYFTNNSPSVALGEREGRT